MTAGEQYAVDEVLAAYDAHVRLFYLFEFLGNLFHLGLAESDGLLDGLVLVVFVD